MGWSYDETNDVWLREDGTTATGLMTSFAPLSVADMSNDEKVNDAIDTIVIGEAMGYYLNPDDGYWYRDRAYTDRLTGIIASLADTKIGGLGTKIENLTLGDAFDASAFNSGFLSLLDPDTRITEMDTAATDAYQAANIEKLIDAGLLSFTPAQETSLDYIFGSNAWKAFTIQEFLNQLILRAASAAFSGRGV